MPSWLLCRSHARQQLLQICFPHVVGEGPQIILAHREDIEGVKLHLVIVLAAVQRVEVAKAVHPKDDGFAIDHKALLPVFQSRFGDPGIAFRPIGAVTR